MTGVPIVAVGSIFQPLIEYVPNEFGFSRQFLSRLLDFGLFGRGAVGFAIGHRKFSVRAKI
jgi:hypothetical protein